MLQNKSNKIFDEMNNFFTSSEKAILKTIKIYESLKLNTLLKKENLKSWEYPKGDVLLNYTVPGHNLRFRKMFHVSASQAGRDVEHLSVWEIV